MGMVDALAHRFAADHPYDAAQALERLGTVAAIEGLSSLPAPLAAGLLERFDTSAAVQCLENLDSEVAAAIVSRLPLETAALFLRPQALKRRTALLQRLPPDAAEPLRRSLSYPARSAGALMNPRVFTLPADVDVGDALERVRRSPEHAMYYLYLVDRRQRLTGVINIRELMLADPDQKLAAIAHPQVESLSAHARYEDVADHPGWLSLHALPVVDEGGLLVGVLRHKALRQLQGENEARIAQNASQIRYAGAALGDLYRIGLAGFARATLTAFTAPRPDINEIDA